MVMLSSTLRGRVIKFASPALPPNTLLVLSFQGREAISTPFRFEIEMVSMKADIDSTAMIQQAAFLGIKQGVPIRGSDRRGIQTLKIHGTLSSFEQLGQGLGWVGYRAVLVPSLWRLSLNVQSRIFQDKKVPEIVEEVLKGAGLAKDDYEFRATAREYPKREYVVQYQESDLNFISRLLEHEGIFYFFEQGEEREKVVFGDSPDACKPIVGEPSIPYRPPQSNVATPTSDWFDPEVIQALTYRENRIQSEVVLRDYNYRTPAVDLKVSAPVISEGIGTFYEYGDHYKDKDQGKAYAQVRAEEIACRRKLFLGTSDCRALRAGATYTLQGHYRSDFNADYLLTEVRHKATQAIELAGGASRVAVKYQNEFESIPAPVPFRPLRTTPKPKIAGTMHAKVDAAGDGKYAEIDDEGRYKIMIPFDLSGKDKAKATRWIRMAQPYSGPNFGIHFPLHKGAEVILVHQDGDPDRPIIASAVPNPETATPVKGENQSQCMIRTGGGNQIMIEDTDGSERISLSSPHSKTSFSIGSAK